MFLLLVFLLGCLLPLKNEVGMSLCVCCLFFFLKHKTRLLSCLDLVSFLFVFFIPIKKNKSKTPPKTTRLKPPKPKTANLGPVLNLQHIYIYMRAVKLLIGPSLGVFKVSNWSKSKLLTGPRSFSHYINRGFRRFFLLSYHCVCVFLGPNYLAIF